MRLRLAAFTSLIILVAAPAASHAAAFANDLELDARRISFSKPLIAGDTVRIYAQVRNRGTSDMEGYVSFFQGSVPIGNSQPLSLRIDGLAEEVFVDFTVPASPFNIRAEIRGTDPADQNSANDVALTALLTPILDDDHDSVENGKDNCPAVANTDQKDTDSDGLGDACDADADNDGLSNAVETELGTSAYKRDTDGDGVADTQDAYPLDPKRWAVEPVVAPKPTVRPADALITTPKPAPKPAAASTASPVAPVGAGLKPAPTGGQIAVVPTAPVPVPASTTVASPHAVFNVVKNGWNAFTFTAFAPEDPGYAFVWDFGDGSTSARREATHVYLRSGTYAVKLTVTDPSGAAVSDTTTVRVPLFSIGNPVVIGLLAVLGLLALIGLFVAWRVSRRPVPSAPVLEEDDEDEPEET